MKSFCSEVQHTDDKEHMEVHLFTISSYFFPQFVCHSPVGGLCASSNSHRA